MPLTTLFVDINSYFASIEQQERPELRGRPVAVVPVMTDSTCCIAASYEAKAFGVRTGTRVGEARKMCPGLVLVHARHDEYVRAHHRILEAAESVIPVTRVHSIDEFSCRLWRDERTPERATEVALAVKRAIRERVGEHVKCSAGIAPNAFLAKVATDIQKPDGLVVIRMEDLPHRLFELTLRDIPGIGRRMEMRLNDAGIDSMRALCALDEGEFARVWGSVVGRSYARWLRGEETLDAPTRRRSIGHQHVLAPALRHEKGARAVLVRLLMKAAFRARCLGYRARRMSVSVRSVGGDWWGTDVTFPECNDTLTLVELLSRAWARRPRTGGRILQVGVTLEDVMPIIGGCDPMFSEARRRSDLSGTLDRINNRFGAHAVFLASMSEVRRSAPTRIAFSSIPDLSFPDVWEGGEDHESRP